MYAYVGKTTGKAFMIIQADELESAEEILRRNGFSEADMSEI